MVDAKVVSNAQSGELVIASDHADALAKLAPQDVDDLEGLRLR